MNEFRATRREGLRPRNRDWIVDSHPRPPQPVRSITVQASSRPTEFLTPDELISMTAERIRTFAMERISESYHVRNTINSLGRVMGHLKMFDTREQGRRAVVNLIALRDINYNAIAELFSRAHQSNTNVGLYDVIFSFLIDTNTIPRGASRMNKKCLGSLEDVDYKVKINNNPVNCAAVALEYLSFMENNTPQRRKVMKRRLSFKEDMAKRAYEKQRLLGWSTDISVADIEKYLQLPGMEDHRIVVIFHSMNDQRQRDFKGFNYM